MGGMSPRRQCHSALRMSCCQGMQSVCWRNAVAPMCILSWESSTSCYWENDYCCGLVRKQGICPILLETIFWHHGLCCGWMEFPSSWWNTRDCLLGLGVELGLNPGSTPYQLCVLGKLPLWVCFFIYKVGTHTSLRGLFWDSVYVKF